MFYKEKAHEQFQEQVWFRNKINKTLNKTLVGCGGLLIDPIRPKKHLFSLPKLKFDRAPQLKFVKIPQF